MVGVDETTFSGNYTVASVSGGVLTLTAGAAITVNTGDSVINLGSDTGVSEPNYDGSDVVIYSTPNTTTVITNSTVTPDAGGEYGYWHNGLSLWELILNSSGDPIEIILDITQDTILSNLPTTTGYPLSSVTHPLVQWYKTGDAKPLFSFCALTPSAQYAQLLRVGDRAQTTGDSRSLGYFSATIDSPGAIESQAVYGITLYTGASTASQMGVFGMGQSVPGNGNTHSSLIGVQGVSQHSESASPGGTTVNSIGVSGTAQTGSGDTYTGTAGNLYGVRGNASHRSINITTSQMYGVYGLCSNVSVSGVTTAAGGRFDEPENATNNYGVYIHGPADTATLAFEVGGGVRNIKWRDSTTRFEVGSDIYFAGTLEIASTAQVNGTINLIGGVINGLPRNAGTWPNSTALSGSDTACTNGTAYVGSIFIPANATITGIQYLVGSVGGTDKVIVSLHNKLGTLVANSNTAGTTVGTAAQKQQVAFTGTYAAKGPAYYFVALTFNGTAAKFRTVPAYCDTGNGVVGNGVTQTFGTPANFTVPTTFTADTVPVASIY
jgi:hypothetical protein